MDLKSMSDDDLRQLGSDVSDEQVRRSTMATTVAQVTALAQAYVDGGGAVSDLASAVVVTPTPEVAP
jgi:hypothetical protein